MSTFNTQQFIKDQKKKGKSEETINSFLNKRGIDPSLESQEVAQKGKVNFLDRLKLGFGGEAGRARQQALEKQAGLKGKFDIGDFADIVGSIPSFGGFILGSIGGAAAGTLVAPGAGTVVGGIAGAGVGAGAGEALSQTIGKKLGVIEEIKPKEIATEAVIGAAAEATFGVLKFVGKPVLITAKNQISNFSKAVLGKTGQLLFGGKGVSGIRQRFQAPQEVQEFLKAAAGKGGKTIENVVEIVKDSIKQIADEATKAFVKAEKGIVDVNIPSQQIKNTSEQIIKDFLKITDLSKQAIKDTALTGTEKNILNSVIKTISQARNFTTKGVLALKRKLDIAFRGTKTTKKSDAIVTRITNHLNTLIEGADKPFRESTKLFAESRQFLEKLGVNITGTSKKNVEQTANKLLQLARDLDDPFKREASEALLKEVGNRVGLDFMSLLQSLNAARRLGSGEGVRAGIIREIARILEVGVSKTAAGLGRIKQAGGAIKEATPELGGALKDLVDKFGKVGVFESLKLLDEEDKSK